MADLLLVAAVVLLGVSVGCLVGHFAAPLLGVSAGCLVAAAGAGVVSWLMGDA